MITRGCYVFTLLVSYVLSIPVPSDQVEKDDIEVMKCIVEVIADSLNKPHPIAISQECQDSLTGDDRIASILRHQNLLKELQEIAAQGVSERVLHSPQKKSGEDSDQVTNALGGHPGAEDTTERSTAREEAAQGGGNEVEEGSREKGGESREGNEIGGTNEGEEEEEEEEGEVKEKDEEDHISDSGRQSQEEEKQEEEEEEKKASVEEEEEEEKKEEETHSSSGEDEGKGKEGNGTEEDDSTQVSQDGEAEPLKAVPEAESQEKGSKQEEEVEEEEMEGEPEDKKSSEGAEKESEEETTKEVKEKEESGPGFERWSKRGEESPREPSEGAAGDVRVGVGPEGGNPMEEKQGAPQLLWYAPRHSKENSEEAERRSPEAQELHMMAHGEAEEGSASHRGEDHEIARLAAIESELESVAQRLHELRRG